MKRERSPRDKERNRVALTAEQFSSGVDTLDAYVT